MITCMRGCVSHNDLWPWHISSLIGASRFLLDKGLEPFAGLRQGLSKALQCSPWWCWLQTALSRTLIATKTIYFSKYLWFHDIWVGFFCKKWLWMVSNNINTQTMINKILTYFRHDLGVASQINASTPRCLSICVLKSDNDTPQKIHFNVLAATKQLYEWLSPSVRPSVHPSVTPFWLCSHHRIIMKFSGVINLLPMTEVTSMQKVKVKWNQMKWCTKFEAT